MSSHDDETELGFFEEPETLESPRRPRRRKGSQSGGPRRPSPPPQGAVALTRLAGAVALAIAVVVALVFWVGSCQGQSKHDEYSSYMDSVRPIAQSSAQAGAALPGELRTAHTVPELQARLEQWSRQQQQDYDEALRLRPPGPLQAAHQQVLATLQLRAIGLAGLANALAASGSKSETAMGDSLAQQAQLLSASDIVWADLFKLPATEALTRLGVTGVVPPPSVFVRNSEVISPQSFKFVYGRLKSQTGGKGGTPTGLHGSALEGTDAVVAGQSKPLSTTSPTTVEVAASLQFRVTFTNSGNFQETQVPVTLTILVLGRTVLTQKEVVPSIVPQGRQTVTFKNLQLPTSAFGQQATVHVEIGKVPGEVKLDNNSASYPVFFSLPKN